MLVCQSLELELCDSDVNISAIAIVLKCVSGAHVGTGYLWKEACGLLCYCFMETPHFSVSAAVLCYLLAVTGMKQMN